MKTRESESKSMRRTVLVTGAAAGIGEAIARSFAAHGSRVVLLDQHESVVALATQLAGDHVGLVVDVRSEDSVAAGAASIAEQVGPIDILVNNAGVGPLAPAEHLSTSDWDLTLSTNLRGAFLCARTFAPAMMERGWGRIINVASQMALIALPGHVAYAASKAGMIAMTRCQALEWGPRGVTVNTVSPTLVHTPLSHSNYPPEIIAAWEQRIPTRRFANVEDVTAAVTFLASEDTAMINGHDLMVDGGSSYAIT